jgi:putative redox protein
MMFKAVNENGVGIELDTGVAYGGSGKNPTPMETLLFAMGGCSGMDVVSILGKMRVGLKSLTIGIEPTRRQDHPKYFEKIKLIFTVSGDGVTEEKVRKAIDLSLEKYCSVSIMLREKAEITYDVRIL